MLTRMSDEDWAGVFAASRSRRGTKAATIANSSKRCTIPRPTTSLSARFRPSSATGTESGSGSCD
jgi:hypothetical protein